MITPRASEVASVVSLLEATDVLGQPAWDTPEALAKAIIKDVFQSMQSRQLVFINWAIAGGHLQVGPFSSESDAKSWHARNGGAGTLHALIGPGSFRDVTETGRALCECGHALGVHEHPKAAGRCMAGHKSINDPAGCDCRGFTRMEAAA